jgi:hypothetical protein
MAKVDLIEPGSFSIKLLSFYVVLMLDVCTNCFSYYIEYNSDKTNYDSESHGASLIILAIQGIVQVFIICWIFVLIWKTFLFKFGLIGILCSEFKVLFISVPIHLVLFGLEKVLRLLIIGSDGVIDLWNNPAYQIVYWVRSFYMIYFYVLLFEISLSIAEPVYYKADKWLIVDRA